MFSGANASGLLSAGDVRPLPAAAAAPTGAAGGGEVSILPFPAPGDGQFHILPFPMPGDGPHLLPFPGPGEGVPGRPPSISLPERVAGTAGSERIEVPTGAVAAGLGGDDVFVLTPGDPGKVGQPLAIITDFNGGDSLDLGRLGPGAKVLGREDPGHPWGAARISIDFDGDGSEDGFVMASTGRGPDLGDYQPYPMPTVPGARPLPAFPVEPDGGIGEGPIPVEPNGGIGDGAVGRLMGGFVTSGAYDSWLV